MKTSKKLGLVMIFVVLALVSAGVVVAADKIPINFPIFKGLGDIFNKSNMKIVVNALLIAAVAYFVIPLLLGKDKTPQSKPAHAAMLILIIFLSIIFAVSIGGVYIWEQEGIKPIVDYFIGSEGILKAGRLGVFLGATALFTWFLTFLGVGTAEKGKPSKINFALAFLIGMHLAHSGISGKTLIGIGEAFAIIIFWQNIYKGIGITGGKRQYVWVVIALCITIFLVGWVGSIISPCEWGWFGFGGPSKKCADEDEEVKLSKIGERLEKEGFAAVPGITKSLSKSIWKNKWIILIMIALVSLTTYAAWKEGSFRRMRKDAKKRIWGRILTGIRKLGRPLAWITRLKEWRDKSPENEYPFIFRKLRTELQVYMDYMLRWEVYTVKAIVPQLAQERLNSQLVPPLDKDYHIGKAAHDMNIYKNGPPIEKNAEGEFVVKEKPLTWTDDWGKEVKSSIDKVGFNSTKFLLYKMMNNLKDAFENTDLTKKVDNKEREKGSKVTTFTKELSGVKSEMESRWEGHDSYKTSFDKCGYLRLINSLMEIVFGQYLHYGRYEHSWRFANPEAKWFKCPYSKNENDVLIIDKGNAVQSTTEVGKPGGKLYEVDERGVFIKDLHSIDVKGWSPKEIRFVRDYFDKNKNKWVKGIVDHKSFAQKVSWLNEEWVWFLRDVRDGRFHPYSRTASDYIETYTAKRKFGARVKREASPDEGNPAFDREALKDHGKFVYWGRKNYDDKGEDSVKMVMEGNKYPGISILGFASYIEGLTKIMDENQKVIDDYLSLYVYPTGFFDRDILAGTPAKAAEKAGGGT